MKWGWFENKKLSMTWLPGHNPSFTVVPRRIYAGDEGSSLNEEDSDESGAEGGDAPGRLSNRSPQFQIIIFIVLVWLLFIRPKQRRSK